MIYFPKLPNNYPSSLRLVLMFISLVVQPDRKLFCVRIADLKFVVEMSGI